jgi:hypothetical protein
MRTAETLAAAARQISGVDLPRRVRWVNLLGPNLRVARSRPAGAPWGRAAHALIPPLPSHELVQGLGKDQGISAIEASPAGACSQARRRE